MTDKDVQREIEANERRAREREDRDDGGLVGAIEDALDPFTDVDDEPDTDEVTSQRELNDAEQRPDS